MELQEAIIHAREVSKRCRLDNQECAYQHDKLADWMEELKNIKNILGTEYDLERLKELVEADREGRVTISDINPIPIEDIEKYEGKPLYVVPLKDCDWESHWCVMGNKCSVSARSKTKSNTLHFMYKRTYNKEWIAFTHEVNRR